MDCNILKDHFSLKADSFLRMVCSQYFRDTFNHFRAKELMVLHSHAKQPQLYAGQTNLPDPIRQSHILDGYMDV